MDITEQLVAWGASEQQVRLIVAGANLTEISYIREALLIAFNNPANQGGFMGRVNHNAPFCGITPLAYLAEDPTRSRRIAEHLLALGAPW
jgi:hypothetical protein